MSLWSGTSRRCVGNHWLQRVCLGASRRLHARRWPNHANCNAPYLVKGARYQVTSFDYIWQYYENVFSLAVGPARCRSPSDLVTFYTETGSIMGPGLLQGHGHPISTSVLE